MNEMKIRPKICVLFFIMLSGMGILVAQPKAYFEHYGAEDGLPQQTIMDILQDQKGFMWFSTWDGLCKFDGYEFITYRLPSDSTVESRSNRIDYLFEDKYNNIWTLSYDNQAHRFNPQMETFRGLSSIENNKGQPFPTYQIIPVKSGKVWLLSEENGCICISDSLFNSQIYNTKKNNLTGNRINTVYEDKNNNSWILTNKGLTFIPPEDDAHPVFYFNTTSEINPKNNLPFFSVMEFGNEMWFGSGNGEVWKYDPVEKTFHQILTTLISDIISIKEISSEKILIVSRNNGFAIYNTHNGDIKIYNTHSFPKMRSDVILTNYIDKSKNIWMETDELGVSKFNSYTEEYVRFTPAIESTESNVFPPNFFIFEDKKDRSWVHPRGGGFALYDKSEDKLIPFYNKPESDNWLFSNMLHSAYSDKQGNLWLCTRSHGLEKAIFYDSQFESVLLNNNVYSTISNDVRPIFEDSQKNIWAATKDGKIHVYNTNLNEKGILTTQGVIGNANSLSGIAYCITEDTDKNIWIGTKGEGVYKLIRKNTTNAFEIHHFKNDPNDKYSLSDNNVYSIFEDKNRNIWIGTYGGGLNLISYQNNDGKIINYNNNLANYPYKQGYQVRTVSSDKNGNVCVGTTLGLIMFNPDFIRPQEIDFKVFLRKNSANTLGANDVFDICTTQSGETYIATFGGGIGKIEETDDSGFPLTFKSFNTDNGLPSNIVLSLSEDKQGNLWIATEGGLAKFNPGKQSFENFSEVKRLMKQYNFSENSRCALSDGRMLFGYSHGMIVFDPQSVKNNSFNPYLALVQFKLFNRNVPISDDGPLKKNINAVHKLILKYNQNFFSIGFAALDYVEPKNILYAYKLEGFDKDWIYSGNQRTANYTNLSRGKYTFKVKSTNSDGVWADNERTLPIEVLPPFWATGWAYLFYILLSIVLLYFIFRILYTFYKMRHKILLEKHESEIKTRFFTNISHEIRTPLTMIVSPIENLLQNKTTPEPIRKQLTIVSKNTNRLLTMVNQILDFQKIEQSPLTVSKIEIGSFIESLYENYVKNAEIKNIDYKIVNNVGDQVIWADAAALEKIVVNLLSNAFKYTPEGESIHVAIFEEKNDIAVQIKDTGSGISKEKQERLFKRFESFNEDKSKPSTGIGLSIVKELADKHHAEILVDSEKNKGSSFTVLFKKGTSHLGPDVLIDNSTKTSPDEKMKNTTESPDVMATAEEKINEHPSVLVVEDDDDLRQFVRSILESDYEVHEASNGKEGFEQAQKIIPDFIVSDIMMPEIDGIGLLEKVRENVQTSHILFLLLTAKTTLDDKLEGFEHGADEYITKPFSVSYFKTRVKSLLHRRSELQKYYRNNTSLRNSSAEEEITYLQTNNQDINFIRSVNSFIEEHLGNNDFVIEDMATEMGMSRTVFFKKLKGLTGLAPVEYVRDVSLQKAAEFLEKGRHNVKEVSYMVGMNDAKYFTKCFKKKYNMTPSEYKKRHINHSKN